MRGALYRARAAHERARVGGGAHELLELALHRRLGQLEHARHVLAAVGEVVASKTASMGTCVNGH